MKTNETTCNTECALDAQEKTPNEKEKKSEIPQSTEPNLTADNQRNDTPNFPVNSEKPSNETREEDKSIFMKHNNIYLPKIFINNYDQILEKIDDDSASEYFNFGFNVSDWRSFKEKIKANFNNLVVLVKQNKIKLEYKKDDELNYLMNLPSDFGGLGEAFQDNVYSNVNFFNKKTNCFRMENIKFDKEPAFYTLERTSKNLELFNKSYYFNNTNCSPPFNIPFYNYPPNFNCFKYFLQPNCFYNPKLIDNQQTSFYNQYFNYYTNNLSNNNNASNNNTSVINNNNTASLINNNTNAPLNNQEKKESNNILDDFKKTDDDKRKKSHKKRDKNSESNTYDRHDSKHSSKHHHSRHHKSKNKERKHRERSRSSSRRYYDDKYSSKYKYDDEYKSKGSSKDYRKNTYHYKDYFRDKKYNH